PRGLSTTQAGSLLKHQIPIRTFQQWDDAQPGFLEADLVAHCGGRLQGHYLYTLTLTDIATGWTECLPLLYKSAEAILAAFRHARQLFPFPILGLDTDNGREFINASLVRYGEQERITFTRGRPDLKQDQCFVEQKNGAIVRQFVGHDRLAGQQAYQQLRELYQTLHLYVNCFQPSMKLQSKHHDGTRVCRVYDPAKTPLQRLLLSETLSCARKQALREIALALDPIGLLHQVQQLQRTLLHGTVNAFSFSHHTSTACILHHARPQSADFLDWPRTTRDPFAGEWERILAWVLAQPERSLGEIFQELQRLSPGRYTPSHLGTLQRGIRKIRAHLLHTMEDSWPQDVIQTNAPSPIQPKADPPIDALGSPTAAPVPEPMGVSEVRHQHIAQSEATCPEGHAIPDERTEKPRDERSQQAQLRRFTMTIEGAIQAYLQEQMAGGRSRKTMEWHRTALSLFQQYLVHERHFSLPRQITETELRAWLTWLGSKPTTRGTQRGATTIATYGRSVRAFCHWLVRQGYLEQTPVVKGIIPRERILRIQLIEPDEFARLLAACQPPGDSDPLVNWATARNRAILWILLDTGIRLSELRALRVGDVDREQRTLLIRANTQPCRISLSPNAWHHLRSYLDQHRSKETNLDSARNEKEFLFLSEQYEPLTAN
ncbi:MAG: tyrosine-type recombinase/integrase, partial [Ktedonobacteraceae bacterium]|nr:tyrosine-type recombinase/integrase [Ktedonobacteraceae bacterium]